MPVSRRTVVGFAAAGSALAVTGCAVKAPVAVTSPLPSQPSATSSAMATQAVVDAVTFTTSVDDGATVPVDTILTVTAEKGSLTDVAMTYTDRKAGQKTVQGTMAPDNATWTAGSLLEPGMAYQLVITGRNLKGTDSTRTTTFFSQNLSLKQQIYPTILSGGTVGVAMPVIVKFDVPVTDRAGFQKHMTVTSDPPQEGSWGWQSSTEAHWRPKELWKAGTKVSINVDINSVSGGKGTYGQKSVAGTMTIGRSVILNADLAGHHMQVVIDGAVVKSMPITGGKAGFLTRSGKKVLKEKFAALRMDSETVGIPSTSPDYYNLSNVQYAMRETDSGEFLHAAPWSVSSQGVANVSHGCIGVSTDNGAWLFANCRVGDLINVTGTGRTLEKGNGWTDWNVSYDEFRKDSAL